MKKGIERISTIGMSREEWLQHRRNSIGGSDAAAIVGLSKWATPFSVWADKLGKLEEKPDSEAMRQGRDLEEYVARRWMEATGKKVRRENAILRNQDYPFAHANIDRWIIGENAGLECKTTSSLNLKKFKTGEFPEQYYAQCVHYMAVTGADKWYLAVLILGSDFKYYELQRDQEEIDALMAAEADLWEHVKDKTEPPVDGEDPTTEAVKAVYTDSVAESVSLFGREALLQERAKLKEQIEDIEKRVDEIENTIKVDMGNAEEGVCEGWKVTWKPRSKNTFQAKDFAKAYPKIDLTPFWKTTVSRTFIVKEQKEEK